MYRVNIERIVQLFVCSRPVDIHQAGSLFQRLDIYMHSGNERSVILREEDEDDDE